MKMEQTTVDHDWEEISFFFLMGSLKHVAAKVSCIFCTVL